MQSLANNAYYHTMTLVVVHTHGIYLYMLYALQGRGATTRIDLTDGASLACYRRVAVDSMLADPRQGVYFEVSFDEPDFLRKLRGRDKVRCMQEM